MFCLCIKFYLEDDIDEYDKERIGEVEQEPHLYRFDVRGGGEAGGHWEIDGGQDHHAGDVDGVDHVVLVPGDVVRSLVDQVDQDRR